MAFILLAAALGFMAGQNTVLCIRAETGFETVWHGFLTLVAFAALVVLHPHFGA